ncbi:hypothetical protein [Homoserinimonas sp. A520]
MGLKGGTGVLVAGLLGATLALTGCVGTAPMEVVPNILIEDQIPEEYLQGAIDAETMTWIDRLQRELGDDENFGSPAISRDRSTVTITWFGEPSARLQGLIAEAPEELTVVIQSAAFRPAELAELVRLAVATPGMVGGVEVAMGSPAVDGSGITIGIVELPAGRSLEQLGIDIAEALGRTDVPVTVEVSGRIVPIRG